MPMDSALRRIRESLGEGNVLEHEPMRLHTTFRVGGPADIFAMPAAEREIADVLRICAEEGVPLLVIGNGSNLLVRDGGIRGVVLQIGGRFDRIEQSGDTLTAEAGALLSRVAAEAYRRGLTGMEFASGIPGSVGGAVAMNAGAYDGEMKDVVQSVRALKPDGSAVEYLNEEMAFSYRRSRALAEGLLVVSVTLGLARGDLQKSRAQLSEYATRRREKQPLDLPSAGSFFKRPPGHFAGKLISDAGMKGASVGGAQVSEKHAGFLVNTGGATASDVLALCELVRSKVKEQFGLELETEVRVVGED